MTKLHLHLDGLALASAALAGYAFLDLSWWLFAALIFAPDLFMAGYFAGPRIGATVYNAGHSLIWPAVLVTIGSVLGSTLFLGFGFIWACHIGMDHAFGFGFKYPDAFKHTHFSEI